MCVLRLSGAVYGKSKPAAGWRARRIRNEARGPRPARAQRGGPEGRPQAQASPAGRVYEPTRRSSCTLGRKYQVVGVVLVASAGAGGGGETVGYAYGASGGRSARGAKILVIFSVNHCILALKVMPYR